MIFRGWMMGRLAERYGLRVDGLTGGTDGTEGSVLTPLVLLIGTLLIGGKLRARKLAHEDRFAVI